VSREGGQRALPGALVAAVALFLAAFALYKLFG
jgi:hypothetical protein